MIDYANNRQILLVAQINVGCSLCWITVFNHAGCVRSSQHLHGYFTKQSFKENICPDKRISTVSEKIPPEADCILWLVA